MDTATLDTSFTQQRYMQPVHLSMLEQESQHTQAPRTMGIQEVVAGSSGQSTVTHQHQRSGPPRDGLG